MSTSDCLENVLKKKVRWHMGGTKMAHRDPDINIFLPSKIPPTKLPPSPRPGIALSDAWCTSG